MNWGRKREILKLIIVGVKNKKESEEDFIEKWKMVEEDWEIILEEEKK